MALTDITNVFSRYFVVGFFLPFDLSPTHVGSNAGEVFYGLVPDASCNLDVQDARAGNTALHAAVSHDDIVLVHYLLSKNVRTDIRNSADLTAFELAKVRGRSSVKLFER